MPANTPRRPLSDQDRTNIRSLVKRAVDVTVRQAFDYTTDFPGFIANEAQATGPFALAQGIARQSCRRWARGEGIPSLPGFDSAYGGICQPYLDSIAESPSDGGLAPPFLGGQCPGARYTGMWQSSYQTTDVNGLNPQTVNNSASFGQCNFAPFATGPIAGFTIINTGQSVVGRILRSDGSTAWNAFATNLPNARRYAGGSGSITSISPCPGQPDNCGNPPTEYTPPPIPPGLPPLLPRVINLPGIGDVAIDVTFNPDGSINVSLPDLGIDFTAPNPLLGDDDGGGEDGGGLSDGPPGDIGEPAPPDDTGEGEEAVGCAPAGQVLVGIRVNVLASPPGARQFAPGVFRGACYAYLGVPGNLDHDPAGAMLRDGQFIFAEKDNLTCYSVRANPGYNLRVTPYYREIPE